MAVKKTVKKTTKKPFMPPWMTPEEMPMGKGMPVGNGDAMSAMKKPVISTKAMKAKAKTKKVKK